MTSVHSSGMAESSWRFSMAAGDQPMRFDVLPVILPEKDSPTVDVFRDAFAAPASVAV